MNEPTIEEAHGFVPVTLDQGSWKTPAGEVVSWYEVQTDVMLKTQVKDAMERVLSVYGVSDVVVDAFDQLRKELKRPSGEPD
jgi:hypothetical protein